jgi:GTP1/Obg family GTP-binding protein
MNKRIQSVLTITVLVSLLSAASAVAQQTPAIEEITEEGFSAPAQTGTDTAFYSDAQLHKFVDAQQQINTLREDYKDRIDSAESEADATALRDEVNAHMAKIVEKHNLDIDTYNALAVAYNSEPSIRNRIDALTP